MKRGDELLQLLLCALAGVSSLDCCSGLGGCELIPVQSDNVEGIDRKEAVSVAAESPIAERGPHM